MRVHLVGAGPGMAQLASLFSGAGHAVTASGGESAASDAASVTPDIDLVVVGDDVTRAEADAEAVRAAELGLRCVDVRRALWDHFVAGRRPLVVGRTRGSTTIAALSAWILEVAGLEPGFFFEGRARAATTRRKLVGDTAKPAPFVVDHAFVPPEVAASLGDAVRVIDDTESLDVAGALVVCDARTPDAARLLSSAAVKAASFYTLDGDFTGDVPPSWLAAIAPFDATSGAQPFDLYAGGSSCGRFAMKLAGEDAVRHATAAIAACAEGFGVHIERARQALASFDRSGP